DGPHLVGTLHRNQGVRIFVLQGLDRAADGDRVSRVVAAPAVMGERGAARDERKGRDDSEGFDHGYLQMRIGPGWQITPEFSRWREFWPRLGRQRHQLPAISAPPRKCSRVCAAGG